MVIGAFLLGALLSLAVCALLWGTGRRPYLRVDVEHRETHHIEHHVVEHTTRASVPDRLAAAPVGEPVNPPQLGRTDRWLLDQAATSAVPRHATPLRVYPTPEQEIDR